MMQDQPSSLIGLVCGFTKEKLVQYDIKGKSWSFSSFGSSWKASSTWNSEEEVEEEATCCLLYASSIILLNECSTFKLGVETKIIKRKEDGHLKILFVRSTWMQREAFGMIYHIHILMKLLNAQILNQQSHWQRL